DEAAPGARREGGAHPAQYQCVAVLPGQARRTRRIDPAPGRMAPDPSRIRQHGGRRRQRQEHHSVRRREPRVRCRLPAAGHRLAPDLVIVDLDPATAPAPMALPPPDRERELYDALLMALREYTRKTGFTRAIVPVSGGIDSALALAIAADALGADRVSAFNL